MKGVDVAKLRAFCDAIRRAYEISETFEHGEQDLLQGAAGELFDQLSWAVKDLPQ